MQTLVGPRNALPANDPITFRTASLSDLPAWLWWTLLGAGAAIMAYPLLVTDLPQLGDYLNHLARMYVITHIGTDPVLARIYEVSWGVVPNLAVDLIVPPLSHLVPLEVAGRLFIALALLLPVAGVLTLHRTIFRERSLWPLASLLAAYNGLFFWGFLNFVVGIGLALLGVALWLRGQERHGWQHLVAASVMALALFVCHMEALGLFGITIGCLELVYLSDLRRRDELTFPVFVRRVLYLAAPFVLPALLFLFAAPLGEGLGGKPLLLQVKQYYWAVTNSWREAKLVGLGMPFASYSPLLDGCAAALTTVLFLWQIRRSGCRVSRGLLSAAALLFAAYPVVPSVYMTAANLDSRLLVFAVLLLVSGVAINGSAVRPVAVGAVLLAGLLIARAGVVAAAWAHGNADLAACREVIRLVAPGERVLIATGASPSGQPSALRRWLYNPYPGSYAPLLTIDRQAFWPSLFTSRTLQPVHVIPPYRAIAVEQAESPSYTALTHPTSRDLWLNPYLDGWRSHFDYVLILQPGLMPADAMPVDGAVDLLRPLAMTDVCSLYAVRK